MKKIILCVLLVAVLAAFASPVAAWDAAKQKALGQDNNKMTWYLLDYGKDSDGVPYAVSRKYYTNASIKEETIENLMSKYGLSPEVAGSLYFTEYGYEYNKEGTQFAVSYLRHYDMLGNEIHGTEYGTEDNPKTFAGIPAGSTPAKGIAYALGKPVKNTPIKSTPVAAKPAEKKAEVPAAPAQPTQQAAAPAAPAAPAQQAAAPAAPRVTPVPVASNSNPAPTATWDPKKQKSLGKDKNQMTWYLLDYGKDDNGTPYAISRKYYTSTKIKEETIELLMSKYGISPEVAGSLYFTEYGYEYNKEGTQFAMTYLRHYDMLGNEIHGTEYGTDDNPKTFAGIPAGSTPAKGIAYALGKAPATSSSKSAVPTRKVKAKKK